MNLVVFTDPTRDCPGDLFDGEYWARPSLTYRADLYKLTVFVPDHVDPATLEEFSHVFAVRPRDLIQIDPNSDPGVYFKRGILKVVLKQPGLILWCDYGEDNPRRQKAFYERLMLETKLAEEAFIKH